MSAQFPTALASTAQLPTSIQDSTPVNSPDHAGQHVQLNYEVIAIEAALGTSPQGSYSTVAAAISSQGTAIVTAQATANTALTVATAAQVTATAALTTAAGAIPKSAFTGGIGTVIVGNSTGAGVYVAVPVGTNGQVLTSQSTASGGVLWSNVSVTGYPGAGVPVSTGSAWGTSNTGTSGQVVVWGASNAQSGVASNSIGGIVTSQTVTFAAATSIVVTSLSFGIRYKVIVNLMQNSSNGLHQLTFNADSGNNYSYTGVVVNAGGLTQVAATGAAYVPLQRPSSDIPVFTHAYTGELLFTTWPGNNDNVQINSTGSFYGSGDGFASVQMSGVYTGAGTLSSMTITPSAGTITGSLVLQQVAP